MRKSALDCLEVWRRHNILIRAAATTLREESATSAACKSIPLLSESTPTVIRRQWRCISDLKPHPKKLSCIIAGFFCGRAREGHSSPLPTHTDDDAKRRRQTWLRGQVWTPEGATHASHWCTRLCALSLRGAGLCSAMGRRGPRRQSMGRGAECRATQKGVPRCRAA
jgi:hypothetical protein